MNQPKLNRVLGVTQVTFYGIGTILGAGIYALIGKVSGEAGILAPVSFVISAFVAFFTAYSYTQLVNRYPKSAGEAEYVFQGFNRAWLSNIVGYLVAFTGIVSSATLVKAISGYVQVFLNVDDFIISITLLFVITTIVIKGIKESLNLAMIITIIEIIGLILICSVGFDSLVQKNYLFDEISANLSIEKIAPVLSGAFIAFYAFIGFEDIVNLAEETKKPGRTILIAIFISLVLATSLYILVALVAVASLPIDALKSSKAPLSDMYIAHGGGIKLMSAIAIFAIINGILAQIIMASRILYGIKHPISILKILSRVNAKTKTPVIATLLVSITCLLFTVLFPLNSLAGTTSFIILIVFTLVNAALILTELKLEIKTVWNFILPTIGIILNLGFLIFRTLEF